MSETKLMKDIQVSLTPYGVRMFRNNTGQLWSGQSKRFTSLAHVKVGPGDVVIRNARPMKFGLCTGSSDLIGWTTYEIKPEHVGAVVAVFTAIEVKTSTGKLSETQEKFLKVIKGSGGFAGVARNLDEAVSVIHGF